MATALHTPPLITDVATCNADLATCNAGTAVAGNVLSGKTFSSSTGLGVTGTMPNNRAVNITPGTSPQTIAAGYHNGSGSVAGDANLVSGNIRAGTSIFGVAGSPPVVDTSSATATAADVASGKTAYVNGSLVTGSATAGSNVNGPNGAKTFTVPDGLYSGSKTATANDTNLAAGNIKSGVTIFGVTGIFLPATCGNGVIDGTEQCDLGTLNSQTCGTRGFTGGTLRCGAGCVFDTSGCYATRYVDNSNGTITDNQTGLVWEKKVKLDGTQDFANLQDADNYYQWAGTCSVTTSKYCQPDGCGFCCLRGRCGRRSDGVRPVQRWRRRVQCNEHRVDVAGGAEHGELCCAQRLVAAKDHGVGGAR